MSINRWDLAWILYDALHMRAVHALHVPAPLQRAVLAVYSTFPSGQRNGFKELAACGADTAEHSWGYEMLEFRRQTWKELHEKLLELEPK